MYLKLSRRVKRKPSEDARIYLQLNYLIWSRALSNVETFFLLFSSLTLALSGEEYRKMSIIIVLVLSTDLSDSRAQESYAPFYFDREGLRRALKMSFYSSFHFIVMA